MNYEIGSRVGDYEILEILGSGGMGRVYKVRNVISDRVEAMKILRPDLMGDSDLADRFMREIKVQGSLGHPNIAALHTALRIDNQIVMVMEYVEGITLHKMMEFGRVSIPKAVGYMSQILSALFYAHEHGVIHRDLKPANIMVSNDGQVKLMDFGIAKLVADRKLTKTGSTIGSLFYMSPEQIRGAQDLDARADLYSLGVTLYEIVTGVRPFKGDSEYSIMEAHLRNQPTPPIDVCNEMPPGLSAIILRALEKEPNKRFQSADEFRKALSNMVAESALPDTVISSAPLAETVVSSTAPQKETKASLVGPPRETMVASSAPIAETVVTSSSRWKNIRRQRGLWIAAGALLTLAVIVVVAMQLPNRSGAAGNAPAIQKPAAMESKPTAGAGESNPVLPSRPSEGKTEKPIIPTASSMKPDQPVQAKTQSAAATNQQVASAKNVVEPIAKTGQPTQIPPQTQSNQTSSQQAISPSASTNTVIPPSVNTNTQTPSAKQLMMPFQRRHNDLRIRADTIKDSLDNLRSQQKAEGLGLRQDIAAAARRMDLSLKNATSEIESGDAQSAKEDLDSAERDIQVLEKFFNRK